MPPKPRKKPDYKGDTAMSLPTIPNLTNTSAAESGLSFGRFEVIGSAPVQMNGRSQGIDFNMIAVTALFLAGLYFVTRGK